MTDKSHTTNPTSVNRRAALRLVPYVKNPTSVAITGPALAALPEDDRLAMLINRYYAEVDAFNAADRNVSNHRRRNLAGRGAQKKY